MHRKVIVIYADYGSAWAWDEEGVCMGSDNDAIEDYEINQGLLDKFDSWQRKFESAPFDEHGNLLNFDWEEFHKVGLSLCHELKRALGDVTVVYEKPFEDPNHDKDGRVEIK